MPTAAAVIIGDEILTGKFRDENGPFLVARLRTLGADLKRLVVVGDEPRDIADEVRRCAAAHDHVITTGGVGPTHDDRTMEGLALAFDAPLAPRDELLELLDRHGLPRSETNVRMASVPAGAELVLGPGSLFPIVRIRNVWVFPGVPKLMQVKFETIARHFAGEQVRSARLYTDQPETDIAELLMAVAARHPTVAIGSYPRFGEGNYRVIVTLESRDDRALDEAAAALSAGMSLVVPSAGG